jgi:hypothetical protein
MEVLLGSPDDPESFASLRRAIWLLGDATAGKNLVRPGLMLMDD